MLAATWMVQGLAVYTAAGALFALWLVAKGIYRLDPQASNCSIPFRLIIVPGVVALWPLLLWKVAGRRR